ncbi:hypothetical protein KSX_17350 [Ktedonospora formicarum]|uniref:Uncharacterized protein n=1 Tax=Ktedonospora formicarum TaxID=2778364 RepID=A0A8J3MP86_9CHLR|nr:hypothetical protein KSX_17350 [Ktedonospora formicarum]
MTATGLLAHKHYYSPVAKVEKAYCHHSDMESLHKGCMAAGTDMDRREWEEAEPIQGFVVGKVGSLPGY